MKKLLLFISFLILSSAVFSASLGGWAISNPIADGASTVYNGTKNVLINGKNVVKKGTAIVTPTATGVAKTLAKGVAGVALSVAVEQLLGAVDWVLDPVNNQIKYKEKSAATCTATECDPTLQKVYKVYGAFGKTAQEACANAGGLWESRTFPCQKDGQQSIPSYVTNPAYNPNAQPQDKPEKTLPLDVVAQKVISNAQGGDAAAQVATTAAAADIVSEAEKDDAKARPIVNQLESSAETSTDETATGETTATDPTTGETTKTGDLKLTFPVFCDWAPLVCEASQKFLTLFEEPEIDEPLLPMKELDVKEINKDLIKINSNNCPADISVNWDGLPFGIVINESVAMQPYCDKLEPLKYVFQLITFVLCVMILARI